MLYIHRNCRVVYVTYFIQYSHCMYICCIFSYHCSLWMASTVLYCWILYLSVAALLIMMSIVLHRTWGVTVCIHFTVYVLYIRRTLSCCICRVFNIISVSIFYKYFF